MQDNRDNEQRRNEFVEAAEKLFRKNGIVDTTVSAIVSEMNVAKGLFYYYFNSKDDVIEAISEKYNQAFRGMMQDSLDAQTDYREKLTLFLDNSVKSFQNLVGKLKGTEDGVDLSQLANRSMDEAKETASNILEDLLNEGNRLGEIHIQHARYLADILISGMAKLAEQGEATADEIIDIMMKLIDKSDKE